MTSGLLKAALLFPAPSSVHLLTLSSEFLLGSGGKADSHGSQYRFSIVALAGLVSLSICFLHSRRDSDFVDNILSLGFRDFMYIFF